jgi:hypothetical protein
VNPGVAAGRNAIRLRFDWPDDMPYAAGVAHLGLRVEERSAARGAEAPPVLVAAEWPNGAAEAYPDTVALEFEVRHPPPSKLWSQASAIDLTPETRDEIAELAGRVHHAVAARNVDRAAELLDYRAVDIGRCFFMSTDDARRAQWTALESIATAEGGELEPLDLNALEMHPVADRRLIWVTRREQASAIAAMSSTGPSMHLFVARINDVWTVVR